MYDSVVSPKPARRSLEVVDPPLERKANNRLDLDVPKLVRAYLRGQSEKAIAEALGVSRQVIAVRLREAGVPRRDRSAAMFNRMANTSAKERARLASAAHDAVRGKKRPDAELRRRALSRSRLRGDGETIVADALRKICVSVKEQAPVDRYNVDVLADGIAVEPRCATGNPMRNPHRRKRTEYLLSRGIATLWVTYTEIEALLGCLDEVIAHFESMRSLPPDLRQHRVIRCAAHHFTRARNDLGQIAAIPAPVRFECRRVE